MGISGQKLEMLFIKNNERSKGLGKHTPKCLMSGNNIEVKC